MNNKNDFGWYVTGFADGESCFILRPFFRITKTGLARIVFAHRWSIQVREDDIDIINSIKSYLDSQCKGVGSISHRIRKLNSSADVTLQYDGFRNCEAIINHFDSFPLQAKKKKDFLVWREAYYALGKVQKDKIFKRQYSFDEVEERLKLCNFADKIRVGRFHLDMKDLGLNELLRRAGGSNELYSKQTLDFLLKHKVITGKEYLYLFKTYRVKI